MRTMRRWEMDGIGRDRLALRERPIPGPGRHEVLVAVGAVALNHRDKMVIESGRTRTRAAREAIERVRTSGGRLLGVVLTKSTEESSSYAYRYRDRAVENGRDNLIMISNQSDT